jgi:N-acetylglucosamine-6-phosphate deacetylase
MEKMILANVRVVGSEERDIAIEDGGIAAIGAQGSFPGAQILDCTEMTLLPGFIDVHNHGAVGVDVNEADVEGMIAVGEFLARNGVTAWMPTLVPDSDENYRRVIGEIDRLMEVQKELPIAQSVGVHYEGIFANEKMCGALRPKYFKKFAGREVAELPRLKGGVHMTTFAPEIEGGVELAAELSRTGWIASIGHTNADVATLEKASEAGARHVTHFFNAMSGIHHRNVGVAGWALSNPDITFDIIADGVHVHPRMLELACRAKTPEKTILISDSVGPTGLGDGEFDLWGEKISVKEKRTKNERGSIAGSVISMHDAVIGMRSIGFTDAEVAKMASTNPAMLLGLSESRGTIEVGKRADLVGIDGSGSIRFVMVGGLPVSL